MLSLLNKISLLIDEELKQQKEKEYTQEISRIIGKEIISYGVKLPKIRKIVKKYFKEFPNENWKEICKNLLSKEIFENKMAGIFLLGLFLEKGGKLSISEVEELIKKCIDNWATCDEISMEVVVRIIKNSPNEIKRLNVWIKSKNVWLRRAALVTMVKLKNEIENWHEIASEMLSFLSKEKEPIVKKAMNWLRREVVKYSNHVIKSCI
jgi:3-methyladenine DNA glycosylase AlkD